MGRNRTTPNRGPMVAERLKRVDPREIDRPHGRYTVEFFDDLTGRRVHREVKDNYITPNWERHVLGHQYNNPFLNGPMAHNSTIYDKLYTGLYHNDMFVGRYQDRLWTPFGNVPVPMGQVILTNDDTAEDADDTWLRGLVIAYATRWKATVDASGARGQINEAECAFSNNDNTHKTVWDWTTQQGNGTFQCLGIGSTQDIQPVLWAAMGPNTVCLDDSIPVMLGTSGTSHWSSMASNPVFDGTNMYFLGPGSNTGADNYDLRSLPEASVMGASLMTNDGFVKDARGLTSTLICDTGVAHAASTTGSSTAVSGHARIGLAKVGSDYVIAYAVQGNLRLRRITAAGSQVWQQNSLVALALTTGSSVTGVVYDGSTHLYVICSDANTSMNVYRCNPASGAITATIPIPSTIVGSSGILNINDTNAYPVGLCVHPDGDLLLVTSHGVVKMTVGGSASSPFCYGMPRFKTQDSEQASSPWETASSGARSVRGRYDNRNAIGWGSGLSGIPYSMSQEGSGTDDDNAGPRIYHGGAPNSLAKGNASVTPAGRLGSIFVYDDKLWVCASRLFTGGPITTLAGVSFLAIQGMNFFSKTTLDSPRTKTASQNMKVSYELTWPTGNFADRAPHPDLV